MISPLLLDGAMGTMLMDAGLPAGSAPDILCLSKPERVGDVHRKYVEAGADIITTNSFGANPVRLSASGHGPQDADAINRSAVRVARNAAETRLIAGDIGPTGLLLQPHGSLSSDDAFRSFHRQISVLIREHVDMLLIETMFSLAEALQALRAARSLVSSMPVWVSMTFRKTRRGFFSVHGDEPFNSMTILLEEGADRVGANCTLSSGDMSELAEELCPKLSNFLFFQPNAGEPVIEDRELTYPESPQEFTENIEKIASYGAYAVGGCCGTTPEYIRSISLALRGRSM